MTVKLLVDMNLSPDWVPVLKSHGWSVVHWSTVGDPRASDRTIMEWAAKHEYVVLTHDLDFSAMLRGRLIAWLGTRSRSRGNAGHRVRGVVERHSQIPFRTADREQITSVIAQDWQQEVGSASSPARRRRSRACSGPQRGARALTFFPVNARPRRENPSGSCVSALWNGCLF